jgi:hypothetical protein
MSGEEVAKMVLERHRRAVSEGIEQGLREKKRIRARIKRHLPSEVGKKRMKSKD